MPSFPKVLYDNVVLAFGQQQDRGLVGYGISLPSERTGCY
jgi:hypothetical protein